MLQTSQIYEFLFNGVFKISILITKQKRGWEWIANRYFIPAVKEIFYIHPFAIARLRKVWGKKKFGFFFKLSLISQYISKWVPKTSDAERYQKLQKCFFFFKSDLHYIPRIQLKSQVHKAFTIAMTPGGRENYEFLLFERNRRLFHTKTILQQYARH